MFDNPDSNIRVVTNNVQTLKQDRCIAMFSLQRIHIIALLAAIFLISKCYAHPMTRRVEVQPLCSACGEECDKCEFGSTVTPFCKFEVCRHGPGQMCGGVNKVWGECGEGMSCNCNQCTGCSTDTFDCFENLCLPHQSFEHNRYGYRLPIVN